MKIRTLTTIMASSLCAFALEVVLPEAPTTFENTAAEELVLHLKKAYGKEIATVSEKNASGGLSIYVGNTGLAAKNGIDRKALGNEEWVLKTLDANRIIAAGGSPRGVIYSAYELLERLYGVMWLDEYFTVVPKSERASWPMLDLKDKPDFRVRDIHTYYSDRKVGRWLCEARNRNNYFHDEERVEQFKAMQKYGVFTIFGQPPKACHTYYYYTQDLPPELEDCLSLNAQGKRVRSTNGSGPGQICLSNPKTLDWFEKKLREFIAVDRKETPDNPPVIYDISANDNASECQCPGCRALVKKHGSYGGAVLEFTNSLAERIEKDFPEIKIEMFAYETATKAPTSDIKARPNVLVRLAQLGAEFGAGHRDSLRTLSHKNNERSLREIHEWAKIATISIWDYWITYSATGPGLCFDVIPENLRRYHSLGIDTLFVEHERPFDNAFYALRIWLGRRFMNDTSLDIMEQTDRFLAAYYGEKAAPFMKEMLLYIRKCQDAIPENLGKLPLPMRKDFSKEFFATCYGLVDKALAETDNADYRKHIIKERFFLDLVNLKKFKAEAAKDIPSMCDRMREDFSMVWREWATTTGGDNFIANINMLQDAATPLPAPAEHDGYKVIHQISWKEKIDYNTRFIEDDNEAFGGRAIVAEDKTWSGFSYGYYVPNTKKYFGRTNALPIDKIPQDGKYHFYKLGKVTLDAGGYFYAHNSWHIQWFTDHLYVPGGDNDYIAYISLKAVGPAYVKDSKDTVSAIYSDRVLLVREK
ncbi:MAG: DUF4838 domain-containing protein [Victivallales bacterium]|nr:DUF4838 domain-containing protein [Victivallales bacterium]